MKNQLKISILLASTVAFGSCSHSPRHYADGVGHNYGKVPMTLPFMEHPTGQFDSAVDAMADAIDRLRKLSVWEEWITFCAQGSGGNENSYKCYNIRVLKNLIQVDDGEISIKVVCGGDPNILVRDGSGYLVRSITPREMALLFDSIFKKHYDLKLFRDEPDYPVGAEW
jgi:hypothetical protein